MNIYTVEIEYDYEGFTVAGVFSEKEKAIKFIKDSYPDPEEKRGDSRDVVEYEVDGEGQPWGSVGKTVWSDDGTEQWDVN